MITQDKIAGRLARAVIVDVDDNVLAFRVGNFKSIFDGQLLKIGIDGEVYAVFPDSATAEDYAPFFSACSIACYGGAHNAYHIPVVH